MQHTSARAEVSRRVRGDLPGAVADVVATVREQVPAYVELSAAQRDEVEAIAGWAIGRVLELWVRDEELSPADVRRFGGIGAARALDGRPLPGVLRAYRVGAARMTDLVADAGRTLLSADDALALARLWMGALDLLSEAMYDGYARASDRVQDRAAALGDLLADLVSGRQSVRTALADRCRELGVVLPLHPVVLVTTGPPPYDPVLHATIGGLEVALLAPGPCLTGLPHDGARRACRVAAHDVGDVPRAHRLAELVVSQAPGHAFPGGVTSRALDEGDAQVVALLRGHRDADPARLAGAVLGTAANRPELLATLDGWLRTGSAVAAADALDVHAQTVRHRLRTLHRLTGRDPAVAWDRFTLAAARC